LVPVTGPALPAAPAALVAAGLLALLARVSGQSRLTIAARDASPAPSAWWRAVRPITMTIEAETTLAVLAAQLEAATARAAKRGPVARDLAARQPAVRAAGDRWLDVQLMSAADPSVDPAALAVVDADGIVLLHHDPARLSAGEASRLQALLSCMLTAALEAPATPTARLPRVPATDLEQIAGWNSTAASVSEDAVLQAAFERHVTAAPAHAAVRFASQSLTYAELDARANALAAALRARGVGQGSIVGIMLDRSPDLVAAVLGVLKAGAAYLPLDPAYPADRLAFMQRDSQAQVVLASRRHRALCVEGPAVLLLDGLQLEPDQARQPCPARSDDLAYVIYTSGSTGTPKGVMVEHRNVLNFFTAMDQRLGTEPGTWLAVTSLSFDISVLELLWTLARGFTVEIASAEPRAGVHERARPLDFSLFYFSADATSARAGGYSLLLEGAKFADTHDFTGVWVPERHFHAFGGLYPNPSVTGAAVAAAVTTLA
jgi:non-ribosomal peptide synthetase component F